MYSVVVQEVAEVVRRDLSRVAKKRFVVYVWMRRKFLKNFVPILFELKSVLSLKHILKLKQVIIVKHVDNYEFLMFVKRQKGDVWLIYRLLFTKKYGHWLEMVGKTNTDGVMEVLKDEFEY